MKIKTNNVPRDLLDWDELTAAERAEFDYIDDPESDGYCRFFRYRGSCYDASDFMLATGEIADAGWDGFNSDSFFSGIAIRYPQENGEIDSERVIVALVLA